jgi:hypothetical protein
MISAIQWASAREAVIGPLFEQRRVCLDDGCQGPAQGLCKGGHRGAAKNYQEVEGTTGEIRALESLNLPKLTTFPARRCVAPLLY